MDQLNLKKLAWKKTCKLAYIEAIPFLFVSDLASLLNLSKPIKRDTEIAFKVLSG